MHDYSTDDRLYEFLEYVSFKTLQDTRNYIKKLQNRMAENKFKKKAMYWFVRRIQDTKFKWLYVFVLVSRLMFLK